MTEKEKNTETKILEAAKDIFLKKGMAGARMQEIADEANINKSLLHYYYRSKEKLFLAVFQFAIKKFVPGIQEMLLSEKSLEAKIRSFTENYIEVLLQNPFVPMFIIQEIQRDPDRLFNVFREAGIEPARIIEQFQSEIDQESIRDIDPKELLLNMLSLCIFPFAAKPVMQRIFFENDNKAYLDFLKKRKETVSEFILNALKK
jgi:AcrR family transcriptional regulator